jgi:hypothetical protein
MAFAAYPQVALHGCGLFDLVALLDFSEKQHQSGEFIPSTFINNYGKEKLWI